MKLLVSGEGPTDMGLCPQREIGEGDALHPGPMLLLLDRLIDRWVGYSLLDSDCVRWVAKHRLAQESKALPRKRMRLPGAKVTRETGYFEKNARALGQMAQQWSAEEDTGVLAVLFRDSDGTRSSDRSLWEDKLRSMTRGFALAGFKAGIPMVPKPKSEAWLLCALRTPCYQNCTPIEEMSGNDNAPNSLKKQLEALGVDGNREALCQLVNEGKVDPFQISMTSFDRFTERLAKVLSDLSGQPQPLVGW